MGRNRERQREKEKGAGRCRGTESEGEAERKNIKTKGFRNRHRRIRVSHRWIHGDAQRNTVAKAEREREIDNPRHTQTYRENTTRDAEAQSRDGETESRKQMLGDSTAHWVWVTEGQQGGEGGVRG